MAAIVKKIISVEPFGDNLSVVKTDEDMVIANRKEDGSFRWEPEELCVYVEENSTVPDSILKERGYWDETKSKGLLGGNKGNKVKGRNFGPEDDRKRSIGILFKVTKLKEPILHDGKEVIACVSKTVENDDNTVSEQYYFVNLGDDVSEFLGIS